MDQQHSYIFPHIHKIAIVKKKRRDETQMKWQVDRYKNSDSTAGVIITHSQVT